MTPSDQPDFSFQWVDLPSVTDTPGTGGVLRAEPEDFVVEEVPAYLPSGEGEYLYVHVRKVGHTTLHVVRELARQLGVNEKQIGVAGLKDRHAVTTQWLSLPQRAEARLGALDLPGVDILEVSRHTNKLMIGHLHGNRFRVRVRQAPGTADEARAMLERLAASGVPNYFGPQRFGLGGLNAEEGLRVMRGESRLSDPRIRRFLVSSVQSLVFNRTVALRLRRGLLDRVLEGDMAKKHDTGGVFTVQDPEAETPRAQRGEISATGTLFGRKVKPLTGDAGLLEQESLDAFGLTREMFGSRHGDRRYVRVFPSEPDVTDTEGGYRASFVLPKGSFATSVLRELTKTDVDAPEEAPDESSE